MKQLLDLGAKPRGDQVKDAARMGEVKMVRLLVGAGADPNGTPNNPPLVTAAYRGERKVVEYLLEQPTIEVNKCDIDGLTALWAAVNSGDAEIVDLLLEAGADPTIRIERGESPADRARKKIEDYEYKIKMFEEMIERFEGIAEEKGAEPGVAGARGERD